MDKKLLERHLSGTYDRNAWLEMLKKVFKTGEVFASPQQAVLPNRDKWKKAFQLGSFKTQDGYRIAVFEVVIEDNVLLDRNRVTLRSLLKSYYSQTDGIFAVFIQNNRWRFSFISQTDSYDESKEEWVKTSSEPKRYTYVLGEGEAVKTAVERFGLLLGKEKVQFKDVIQSFSVEKLSKRFFNEYKEQYDKFVGYLTGKIWTKNGVKSVGDRISQFHFFFKATTDHEKEARDFVKKLLGRIVFLCFVQKKQWLGASNTAYKDGNPEFIYDLFRNVPSNEKDQFYSQWLTKLFFETLNRDEDHAFTMPDGNIVYIPFLNGGLFERDETDKNTEHLPIPAKLFSNPDDSESPNKRGFLDFLSAYNFTIHEDSPHDQTIAVDPEMLGHIFENLLEDNKEKGAYYTPKPIVHYMCQESLIEYLLTKLTADSYESIEKDELRKHLEDLIKKQEAGELVSYTEHILKSLKDVKVCDPAIGSGAFPMGILQEIYQAVETLHHLSPDNVQAIWKLPDNEWHPAVVKKQIIQNSIYGVDIEKGAVDIARLRFWLSLIVDEEEPTALPNLDYKIVVGDSLVSNLVLNGRGKVVEINWEVRQYVESLRQHLLNLESALSAIVEKKKSFFEVDIETKNELRKEIEQLKLDALIHQLKYNREYYNRNVLLKGGGMPTPADIEHNLLKDLQLREYTKLIEELQIIKSNPDSKLQYFDWKLDFAEILNPALNEDSIGFDVIIGNPPYGITVVDDYRRITEEKLGKVPDYEIYYLFIQLLRDLVNSRTVCTYIIPNSILFNVYAEKYRSSLLEVFNFKEILDLTDVSVFDATVRNIIFIVKKDMASEVGYRNPTDVASFKDLLNKEREYMSVDELLKFSHNWALAFRLPPKVVEVITKIKSDKTTVSERFNDISQGLIAYDKRRGQSQEIIESRAYHYFEKINDDLKPWLYGGDVNRYDLKWNEKEYIDYCDGIANPREPKFFDGKRILVREITNPRIYAAYTEDELYNDPSLLIIKDNEHREILSLLGILNSKLATFYHFNNSPKATKGAFPKVLIKDLKEFPLHERFGENILSDLVDKILTQKEANPAVDTTDIEQQIDTMVYKLYNLTWEEVKVVDPEFELSEEEYEAVSEVTQQ